MNDAERFERLEEVLNDIQERCAGNIILVEGKKDVSALRRLGLDCEIICIQRDGGPLKAAEMLSRMGKGGIILTDWDSRGNRLADDLEHQLSALCIEYDSELRERLRDLCIKDVKDVESLDSLYKRLENAYYESTA